MIDADQANYQSGHNVLLVKCNQVRHPIDPKPMICGVAYLTGKGGLPVNPEIK